MARPRVAILHAPGTNRDHEAALAARMAGGEPEIVRVGDLEAGEKRLGSYDFLILPGGFTYGDALGAGKLWALDLRTRLGEAFRRFVEAGRPVLGICNGFQALVKSGVLPFFGPPVASLVANRGGRFLARWVELLPQPGSPSLFLDGLKEPIHAPIAHGEGRFVTAGPEVRRRIEEGGLVALRYRENPNGSELDLAGLTNPEGNVLGLMPHPEDHLFPWQHPGWRRGAARGLGLPLFEAGVRHA